MSEASITDLRRENDEKAAAEAAAIRAEMRQRLERIIARAKQRGEVRPHVTVDDLLRRELEP